MQIIFSDYFVFFLIFSFLVGLAIGSFLNVVIYRLPIMLEAGWRRECCELLQVKQQKEQRINLMWPRSRCPHCQKQLRSWHNIPLISYLLLKGKCAYCKHPISCRYPLIELLTGLLTVVIVAFYGFTWQMPAILIFTW